MPSVRVAPAVRPLNCIQQIYGYLKRNPNGAIQCRVKIPSHERFATPIKYDWTSYVCGYIQEELPTNMSTPIGKLMRNTTYQDATFFMTL